MNLLIVFVILFVLLVSETGNHQPVDDVWVRLSAIAITTFVVPMLAGFQTMVVTHRLRRQKIESDQIPITLRRLTACHSAIWLVASLAIVYSFQWQTIVRGNWNLDHWPLLDEILIISPVILSLVASWAIFYDIQSVYADRPNRRERLMERLRFVALRVRVYLAVFLIPTLLTIGAKDLLDSQMSFHSPWMIAGLILGVIGLLAAFPFLVLVAWKTQRLDDTESVQQIDNIVRDHRLKVAGIRLWKTNRQIVNAVVAGVIPYFRFILISDGLIQHFSQNELNAIIRHEAGHIRRWHLASRMLFILLPVGLLFSAEWCGYRPLALFHSCIEGMNLSESYSYVILAVLYCIYILMVLSWLSKRMEFDADQYAITQQRSNPNEAPELCSESTEHMIDALLQFAELLPSQVDKKSFWHPTIRERLIRIEQLKRTPHRLEWYAENFVYHQFLLAVAIIVLVTLVTIASSWMSMGTG